MGFSWLRNITAIAIRALTLAAKFLLVLYMIKYFKPEELGLYGVLTALTAYGLFFLGLEFYNYTSRVLVGASDKETVLIIRDQFLLYGITFILLSPLFYCIFYINIFPYFLCFWFFIIIIFEHTSSEMLRILVALSYPYLSNIVFFVRQGLWVYILLPIFYFYPESRKFNIILIGWILGAAFSTFIGLLPLYRLPWSNIWIYPVRWRLMWNGLKISKNFLISAFCALSLLYIERFFVNYYCGIAAVGIYTFYAGLSITLHSLVNTGVAKMRLAQLISAWKQNDSEQFYLESMHMLKYTIIFVVSFSIISILCVYPFVHLLNKQIYLNNINIFYILLFGAACRSVADVPLYTLYAQHNDKLILSINLSSFLILIIGNAILVPQLGLIGAAISSAIASLVLLGYSLFIMLQRTIRPLNSLLQT
jgi:O-antigen/teichoic acid export membrane protein